MEEEGSTLLGTCRFDLKHFFPVVNYSLCKRVRQKSGSVVELRFCNGSLHQSE